MRDDSGVEVLFRPGSSLPEICRCEKRVAKKGAIKIFVCPSVSLRFGLIRASAAQSDGDFRALYEQHFVGDGCSVISMSRKKDHCVANGLRCPLRVDETIVLFFFSRQVRCEEGQFEVCRLHFSVRVSKW